MRRFFAFFIRIYQLVFAPIFSSLGFGCRFHPSCSQYSKEAFRKYSWHKALIITLKRILRCNPFNPGGLDPVK